MKIIRFLIVMILLSLALGFIPFSDAPNYLIRVLAFLTISCSSIFILIIGVGLVVFITEGYDGFIDCFKEIFND